MSSSHVEEDLKTKQENVFAGPIPLVDLVWKRDDVMENHCHISLVEQSGDHDEHSSPIVATISSDNLDDPEKISPAALQFERQLRKAQHENKKLGQMPETLDVVYVDDDLVVVNKPGGVLTVPGINQNGCILDLVHEIYGGSSSSATTTPLSKEHMIVHRLDMDTSGLLVFGRRLCITKALHTQFREHCIQKEYRALTVGHWPSWCQTGTIDLPLKRDHECPPFMRVATPHSEAQAHQVLQDLQKAGWKKFVKQKAKCSQTNFQVLDRGTTPHNNLPYTHVRLTPVTGRTHQLRVHCAALGFSIVGDPTYSLYGEGSPEGGLEKVEHIVATASTAESTTAVALAQQVVPQPSLKLQKEWANHYQPNVQPMCLHATKLSFKHPTTKETLSFEVEPCFDTYLADV